MRRPLAPPPRPAEPHGPRRCGGPEHSVGLSDALHLPVGHRPPEGDRRLLLITVDNRIATDGESNRQIQPMGDEITVQAASGTTRFRPSRLA